MTFLRADPTPSYRLLRLISQEGRWELGLSPYTHGTRLRMGLHGRPPSIMDFCLGHDAQLAISVLTAILGILEDIPEESEPATIDAAFPWAGTRPNPDLHLPRLASLAASRRQKRLSCGLWPQACEQGGI
ncbi:MAG: hypothetical protein Fur0032_16750 [Terrimicrobiaceae bacterium]